MKKRFAFAGCIGWLTFAPLAWGGVYDVRDYGAKGDGVTKDTAAIQRAIDAAEAAGGGTVEVPAGRYLTGSIFLKDDITLRGDPKLLKRKQDCARITVANCVLSSVCNAVRIGVGDGVVRDATFSNLVVHDTKTAFHLVSGYSKGRGTDISNVRFENIQADCRVFCRVRHGFATGARIGNVTFSGVSGRTSGSSTHPSRRSRSPMPSACNGFPMSTPVASICGDEVLSGVRLPVG